MIDLHTHTFYSDGELSCAEQARRAEMKGVETLAITDHADLSNVDEAIKRVNRAKESAGIELLSGIEVTHVPPRKIEKVVEKARNAGADIIVAHGETPVEPVKEGTNRAAIEANVDILGHPGLIKREDVKKAKQNNVYLEITARRGHSLANGHVAKLAKEKNADLVINTDAHGPNDFIDKKEAIKIAKCAGLKEKKAKQIIKNAKQIPK